MKKIIIFSFIIAGMLLISSCSEDWLDRMPLTELTETAFYQTPEDAEMALVGCYNGLQRLNGVWNSFPLTSTWLSDYTFAGMGAGDGYGQQVIEEFRLSRAPGEVNLFGDLWARYYQGLFRINTLLSKLDGIDWEGNTQTRDRIEAEARFLRAYFYFDMVRLWEKVPLLTEPTTENLPQATPDEIYTQITSDLLFAIDNASETVQPGRVNSWAAKSYMARVYLFYTGYYGQETLAGLVSRSQALTWVEEVTGSGRFGLVEEYKDLWPAASTRVNDEGTGTESSYAGKDNIETIFAIKHNISNGNGNSMIVMQGLRTQNSPPYGSGWGGSSVRPSFYNSYEVGDERRDASIISFEAEGISFNNSDQREYTGFITKKYIPVTDHEGTDLVVIGGGGSFADNQYQDYVSMRYADVLLMAAELGSSEGQTYLDMVRTRAGLDSKPLNFANIIAERRYEFAFEGIGYWDLLRQGLEVAAQAVSVNIQVLSGGTEEMKIIRGEDLLNTRGFQQIPGPQVTLSGGILIQNPGWE